MPWWNIVRDIEDDHRLREPASLRALLEENELREEAIVMYCQSGTRSAGVLFALEQLGRDQDVNYDGSWAEYSHLDLPVE